MNIVRRAIITAKEAHRGQVRKGTGEPYIKHLASVASRILINDPHVSDDVVAAAWLHDTIEDTSITYVGLCTYFGDLVGNTVLGLSNPSHGNEHKNKPRVERKRIDREHLSVQGNVVKYIKLADRIDNLWDFHNARDGFAYKYAQESKLLLEVLRGVDEVFEFELESLIHKILKG